MLNLPFRECTGCTACVHSCPVSAISMIEDGEGFLRPTIDQERCINCGKCDRVCPMKTPRPEGDSSKIDVFAAKNRDEAAHKTSQSGGVFYALAKDVLDKGGIVYGAAFNDRFETEHIRVDALSQLHRLQSVKYVQSRLGTVFSQAAEDLKKGLYVLFSGTPCQIAGLQAFLSGKRIDCSGLLTVDLVCYGVPSPGVFRDWVKCLEKSRGSKLTKMWYRRTDAQWEGGKERYEFADGRVLEGDYFVKWYFRNLIIRTSCESCKFCNTNRPGDITLGDYWGIEKVLPEFFDDRGVSVVLCSTQKGKAALNSIEDALSLARSNVKDAIAAQPRLQGISVKASPYKKRFYNRLKKYGLTYIAIDDGYIPATLGFRIQKKLESIYNRIAKK